MVRKTEMNSRAIVWTALLLSSPPLYAAQSAADADFETRCSSPGVLRCIDFDTSAWIPKADASNLDRGYNFGLLTGSNTSIDTSVKSSGGGSIRHVFNAGGSNSQVLTFFSHFAPCPGAGNTPVNCGQPFPTGALNTGDQVYIQWRARYSSSMLDDANFLDSSGNRLSNSGFKIADLGLADTTSCRTGSGAESINCPTTCPNQGFELVVTGGRDVNSVETYVNCAGNYSFRGLNYTNDGGNTWSLQNKVDTCINTNNYAGCRKAVANEWMTFKLYVKMGSFNQFNNEVKLWMGREGQSLEQIINCSAAEARKCSFQFGGPSTANNGVIFNLLDPNSGAPITGPYKIGKFYLLPYMTGLSRVVNSATVWYDELIISTQDIADPGGPAPIRPNPPTGLSVN
jgi:hypothetical protein